MNDAAVRDLARRAGVSAQWTDYANKRHRVPLDALQSILAAMGLPCGNAGEIESSRHAIDQAPFPPLITATAGQAVDLPVRPQDASTHARVIRDDGGAADLPIRRTGHRVRLPGIETVGYHTIEIGGAQVPLAVAPRQCTTLADIAPRERVWGLAAQVYGLRCRGDCGIGDMAGVTALAHAAAPLGADAIALSPMHALFTADPSHFSPYSPSSRLFYNPLHADAAAVFGPARVGRARLAAGLGTSSEEIEGALLIDWVRASRAKMSIFRCLFEDFSSTDLTAVPAPGLAVDFVKFRAANGPRLEEHAIFEALHAARLQTDGRFWNWREWPAEWRDPQSAAVKDFAEKHEREVLFHSFLQWMADRSFAAAQRRAKAAGMRVGLIADLAVGMNSGGSHAWTNQHDILGGVQVGAPPDLLNPNGQNWGLTTFSPRALSHGGFAPFIATLRACMRHAGGVRIDHAMGLMRLWVTPYGAKASEGAYLTYPLDDLLRLTALESHRHRAIVIGEDLGTVAAGFRDRLAQTGIYGMSVLWFERDADGFAAPRSWSASAAAMTSTHDLATVAGWWRGSDIEARSACGLMADKAKEDAERAEDRQALWSAFRTADVSSGDLPAADEGRRVADAAVKFIVQAPSPLALLPLEDALALDDQPNLPATIDEHPNWRRRYRGEAGALLDAADVRKRVGALTHRDKS